MPIEINEISDKQVRELLAYKEGHFLDLKGKDIKPSKLTKAISAFANADGGELYVGIAEDSALPYFKWVGFDKPEAANAHVQVFEDLFPLGEDFRYSFLSHPKQTGFVLHVFIQKTKGIVKASNGIAYVRRGAQSLPIDTPEKLALLQRNKGHHDVCGCNGVRRACESNGFRNHERVHSRCCPNVGAGGMASQTRTSFKEDKPTVTGVVLFADLPQAIVPKHCGIKLYRYKTSDAEGTRETLVDQPISVEGCAYAVIKQAVAMTTEIIGGIQVLGTTGLESVNYPKETLHEVITNAILHRDYAMADDVHVRIFDNRVEVESPGRLPAHITPKNILKERFARNGNLVRVINKFPEPPNKDVGEGLNTAFEAMRNLRLKDPVISERDNSVVVQIKHERLASAEDIIMEYLNNPENQSITNRVARGLTGIKSENSMKVRFWRLRDRGLIRQVPGTAGFASAWEKVPEGAKKTKAVPEKTEEKRQQVGAESGGVEPIRP